MKPVYSTTQQQAVATLAAAINNKEDLAAPLWNALLQFQNYPFQTFSGLPFTYIVKRGRNGEYVGELEFSRKTGKTITRSTVQKALQTALKVQHSEGCVAGPKKLGTFGASYLYPVFLEFGVIKKCV